MRIAGDAFLPFSTVCEDKKGLPPKPLTLIPVAGRFGPVPLRDTHFEN